MSRTILNLLGAHGMSREEAVSCYYKQPGLCDIENEITAWIGGGQLYDIDNWNIPVLAEEHGHYRKPRIQLFLDLTTAGALTLTWSPVNWWNDDRKSSSDFRRFSAERRSGQRPDNELCYVRQFNWLMHALRDEGQRDVLIAIHRHLDVIDRQLQQSFDVTWDTKLELITTNNESCPSHDESNVAGARIYDVADRDQELKLAAQSDWERKELASRGIARQQLLAAIEEFGLSHPARVASSLTEISKNTVRAQDVRRWITGIEKLFGPIEDSAGKEPDPESGERAPRPR